MFRCLCFFYKCGNEQFGVDTSIRRALKLTFFMKPCSRSMSWDFNVGVFAFYEFYLIYYLMLAPILIQHICCFFRFASVQNWHSRPNLLHLHDLAVIAV